MDDEWRALLPPAVRRLPADLAAVIALTTLTILVVALPVVRDTPLRIAFGLPLVLFLPGYALVAALFPEAGPSAVGVEDGAPSSAAAGGRDAGSGDAASDDEVADGRDVASDDEAADARDAASDDAVARGDESDAARQFDAVRDRGVDGVERVALSVGLSIAVVPLVGLGLNVTPWGIRLWPVLLSVSAFTVGCAAVAASRRLALPPGERFHVPYRAWVASGRSELVEPEDRVDAALNVVLLVSVLLAVGSVGYAVAVPPDGEQFTEFYLLTEDEDGDLVADGYPEEFVVGEPAEVVVGIGNQEHETVEYTVVAQLQRVETEGNETRVLERRELDRFGLTLEHNETSHRRHTVVAPDLVGEERRLQYLLYRGDPPAAPSRSNAYRDADVRVDVVTSSEG